MEKNLDVVFDDSNYVEVFKSKSSDRYVKDLTEFKINKADKIKHMTNVLLVTREMRRHNEPEDLADRQTIKTRYLESERYVNDIVLGAISEHDVLAAASNHNIFQFKYSFNVEDDCFIESHVYEGSLYVHISAPKSCPRRGKYMFDKMIRAYQQKNVTFDKIMGEWVYGDNLAQVNRAMNEQGMDLIDAAKTTWTGKIVAKYGFTQIKVIRAIKNNEETMIVDCLVEFSKP